MLQYRILGLVSEKRGQGVGGSGTLEFVEGLDGLVDVGFGIAEVVVGENAVSRLVEDVGHSAGEQSKGGLGDTKIASNGIALVGEDAKGEPLLLCELLLGFDALTGDSDDLGSVGLADLVDTGVEALGLLGASGGGVAGVEVDDKGLLEGGSLDCLSVLVNERKVGGGLTDGQVEGRRRGVGGLCHKGIGGSHEAPGGDNSGNELHGGFFGVGDDGN